MHKTGKLNLIIIFAVLSALSFIFFSFYTNQAWDDFFTTFSFSKNLAEGKGAVYNAGERIYGFTSPLEMILLSLCYIITGKSSYLPALWLYRVISMFAFIAAGIFLLLSLNNRNKNIKMARTILAAFYIFETKSIVFSVSGMETAFMLLFLAGFIFISQRGLKKNWLSCGLCWVGIILTRPDGCIYIFALSIAILIFSASPKKETLAPLFKAALVCATAYLPFFLWAWSYYGSAIPNTLQAKAHLIGLRPPLSIYQCIFGPAYVYFGGWPSWLVTFTCCLGLFSSLYWTVPSEDKLGKTLSFTFFLIYFYYLFLPRYPWYYPAATIICLTVLASGLSNLAFNNKNTAILLSILIFCGIFYVFISCAFQLRIQQEVIENGNRKQIGLWLKENNRANGTVYLEPISYIGYFSGSKIIDYPGLVSKGIVRLLHEDRSLDFYTLAAKIMPDWIIVRGHEARIISSLNFFNNNYRLAKTFSALDNLNKYNYIPGKEFLLYDSVFLIYKRVNLLHNK